MKKYHFMVGFKLTITKKGFPDLKSHTKMKFTVLFLGFCLLACSSFVDSKSGMCVNKILF